MAYQISGGPNVTILPQSRRQVTLSDAIGNLRDSIVSRNDRRNADDRWQQQHDLDVQRTNAQIAADNARTDSMTPRNEQLKRLLTTPDDQLEPHERVMKADIIVGSLGEAGAKVLIAQGMLGPEAAQLVAKISGGLAQSKDQSVRSGETRRHNVVTEDQGERKTVAGVAATNALTDKRKKEPVRTSGKQKDPLAELNKKLTQLSGQESKAIDAFNVAKTGTDKKLVASAKARLDSVRGQINQWKERRAQAAKQIPAMAGPGTPAVEEAPEADVVDAPEFISRQEYDAMIERGLTPEEIKEDGIRVKE